MSNQTIKIQNLPQIFSKKYENLFRFVEKTGEEIFVFPKKYKIGINLKPINIMKKEFETKDALDKIERGRKEYLMGKSEKFGNFLKKQYPQYAKICSKNIQD